MSVGTLKALRDRLEAVLGRCELLGGDLPIRSLAMDSRRVETGDLFAALPGHALDGRDFIAQALAAGAVALLLSEDTSPPPGTPALRCPHPRRALGFAAQHLAGEPAAALELLGVTGTNGKSTCAHLLQCLMGATSSWGLLGTVGVETGGPRQAASHTTPDPLALAAHLAACRDAGLRGVALEVSSHALAQERVAGLMFSGVLYTNLSRDHLDYHGDMKRYLAAKASLLALRRPGAPALLNADDPAFAGLHSGEHVKSYGRSRAAHYRVDRERRKGRGSRFRLSWGSGEAEFFTPQPGAFNVMNAAGALALVLELGGEAARLADRLADFPGVPGRMEQVALPGGPEVIVDFAHSPDAVARVLAASRPLCRGRLVVLLGAGGDRDRGKRPLMGAAAQAGADLVVLTSDNPRSEDPEEILRDMEKGMDEAGLCWHKEADRGAAIRLALDHCAPDDLLVLLGKGHETTQEIAGVLHPFDDIAELRRAWSERSESE